MNSFGGPFYYQDQSTVTTVVGFLLQALMHLSLQNQWKQKKKAAIALTSSSTTELKTKTGLVKVERTAVAILRQKKSR